MQIRGMKKRGVDGEGNQKRCKERIYRESGGGGGEMGGSALRGDSNGEGGVDGGGWQR